MNKELEEYYTSRNEMFSGKGWKDLMEDIDSIIDNTNSLDGVDDEKKLHFRKGELSILKWLKGLEVMSNATFDELKAE